MRTAVYCDFDGTISMLDTTDHVLERLASADWLRLEADWREGRIDAAACMRAQVALIGGSEADLDAVLDGVALDPGFAPFAAWCEDHSITLTVVSDGVDRFIHHILGREGLGHLPVITNRMAGRSGARLLEQPHQRTGCAAGAGVCKCAAVAAAAPEQARRLVYVGDGRSDFCVSAKADLLFAKGELASWAAARGQAFRPFDTFFDVRASLQTLLAERVAN